MVSVDCHIPIQTFVQDHLKDAVLLIKRKLHKVHGAAQGDVICEFCNDIVRFVLIQFQSLQGSITFLFESVNQGKGSPNFVQDVQGRQALQAL